MMALNNKVWLPNLRRCVVVLNVLVLVTCINGFTGPVSKLHHSFLLPVHRTPSPKATENPFSLRNAKREQLFAASLEKGKLSSEDPVVETQPASDASPQKEFFLKTLWDFTRPHTLIGSALCIPAIHFYARPLGCELSVVRLIHSIIFAAIPSLLMNLYITGLNQVTDVEIDKISKPYLPIASGKLSMTAAVVIVIASLVASIALGWANPIFCTPALRATLIGSALLGTVYSLPPFRLKRFPSLAALCIIVVRGSLINIGFYAHARAATYKMLEMPSLFLLPLVDLKCGLLTLYFAIFGIVIALMKDVPDAEGDKKNDISSFTVKFGQTKMFKIGRRLMSFLVWVSGTGFLAGAWLSKSTPGVALPRAALGIISLAAGTFVRNKAAKVNADNPKEVFSFYMFLWKIFYASYFFLPFAK